MEKSSETNKRIAKNTLLLYSRMMLKMLVSLYISRVVLLTLGASDFGIYNIVGGIVVLFSFLNNVMINSIQRFLNIELGKSDNFQTRRVFSMGVNCQILIIVVVFILSETIGLWFLNTCLNIPSGRMFAANCVYQLSVISTCVNIFYTPYNAAIIANEKMTVYAYVSIFEVLLKLVCVFLLTVVNFDSLILYVFFLLIVNFLVCATYILYCLRKYPICHYYYFKDTALFCKMMSFSGWSLLGGAANVGYNQGLNIIMNLFFTVTVNAAMGIANQVISAISSFVTNFSTAFNPQIVKSYASKDENYFISLISRTSKLCYFLLFILSLPIIINCQEVLKIWLKIVPQDAPIFCQLIIVCSLIDAINTPIWTAIEATGKIKIYNIVTSLLRLTIIPISFYCFSIGNQPCIALWINIIINFIIQAWNLYHFHKLVGYSIKYHFVKSIIPCLYVTILSLPLPIFLHYYWKGNKYIIIMQILLTILWTSGIIMIKGLDKNERCKILSFLSRKFIT